VKFQIDFSTTTAGPRLLSTAFAENIGPDNVTVFNGPLTLDARDPSNPGKHCDASAPDDCGPPRNYTVSIPLTVPFLYDAGRGNLLMDIRNFGGTGHALSLDADLVFEETGQTSRVSRVYTNTFDGRNVNDLTGSIDVGFGLVTRFEVVVVPEPPTPALVSTGLLLAWLVIKFRLGKSSSRLGPAS
jgi:hypothetical protein